MKRLLNLIFVVALVWGAFYAYGKFKPMDDGKITVYYGSRTICTECNRIMDAGNMKSMRVEPSRAGEFHVEQKKGLCPRCAPGGVMPM